ncbi:MAG TPA: cupredoxin domain-containing protein [Acidimicrobiia bacterium]|jgi:plastocyanin
MRKISLVAASAALLVFVFGGALPAGAKSKAPVTLGQKVNNKGTKDVSTKSKATLEVELDDYYFEPTFIKAKPGEKLTLKVKNEGSTDHTFTSDALSVSKQLGPDKSAKLTITVPSSGEVWQFHCDFHEDMGMVGAVYTVAGASASSSSSGAGTGAPTATTATPATNSSASNSPSSS